MINLTGICNRYQIHGASSFKEMQELIKSEDELNNTYNKLKEKLSSKEYKKRKMRDEERYLLENDSWSIITEMINDGIVFKDKDKLSVNQAMKDTLNKFIAHLEMNGEYKKSRFLAGKFVSDNTLMEIDEVLSKEES